MHPAVVTESHTAAPIRAPVFCRHCEQQLCEPGPAHITFRFTSEHDDVACVNVAGDIDAVDHFVDGLTRRINANGGQFAIVEVW